MWFYKYTGKLGYNFWDLTEKHGSILYIFWIVGIWGQYFIHFEDEKGVNPIHILKIGGQ